MRRTAALTCGLFVVGSVAACGSDNDSDDTVETEAPAPAASDVSAKRAGTGEDADGGGAPTADDGPATQIEVFDPAVDDLCSRVTGDELVAYLAGAGDDVEGPATTSTPATEDATGWDCAWVLASGEEIQLGARTTAPRTQAELERIDSEYLDYETPGQIMEPGARVIGHPQLGSGIGVENEAFLRFRFYPLGSDHVLDVMYFSEDAWCDDQEGTLCDEDTSGYETALMSAANRVLQDLGWLIDEL